MLFRLPFFRRNQRVSLNLEEFMPQDPTLIFRSFRDVVLEETGIKIVHGSDFGSADGEYAIHQASIDLPNNYLALQATVFLNGWSLEYDQEDHHVGHLATQITESRIVGNQLTWEARGMIKDDDSSSFEWHYYYTVIMWDASIIEGGSDHVNIRHSAENHEVFPIAAISSYYQNDLYVSRNTIAILPRGFHCTFPQGFFSGDSHLFQFSYNLDHSETIIEQGKRYEDFSPPPPSLQASLVNSGYVSWDSQTIFRDNSYKRHFTFYENSTVAGSSIELIQPPFMVLPASRVNIGSGISGEFSKDCIIENIPFDYAIPMLTAWDLSYDFGDEHVTKIGVWITDISYVKEFGELGGILRYKINGALYDKDKSPSFSFDHRISVLGFNSILEPGPPDSPVTDPNEPL